MRINYWPGGTIGRHSLSQPFGLPAPSEREPGLGAYHSTGCSLKSGVTGDFHRPYETQKFLHSTIHRTTLPQSALRAASSLREGAGVGCVPFNRVLANIRGCGRFSSPLRNSEDFGFYHSTDYPPRLPPRGSRGGGAYSLQRYMLSNRVLPG